MRVLLISFSGTGITRYFASLIKQEFENQGHDCVCRDLEELADLPELWKSGSLALKYTTNAELKYPLDGSGELYRPLSEALRNTVQAPQLQHLEEEWSSFELIGFGSPVYEFRPAPVMIQVLLSMPYFKNSPSAFSFATHDGAQGDFPLFMMRLLQGRGFNYLGHLDHSFLITIPLVVSRRYDQARAGRRLARQSVRAEKRIQRFISRIMPNPGGGFQPVTPGLTARLAAYPFRLVYTWVMDLLLGKFLLGYGLDKSNCIKCYTCINQCPQGLIDKDREGFPLRQRHCMYCFRCLNWCPTGAIYFSALTKGKARFPGPETLLESAREHHPERWLKK